MIARFLSRLYRNVIIKEPEFGIAEDERVLLRGAATLETEGLLADGTLILTSERLAFRPSDQWAFGGKRRVLEISVGDISEVAVGKKRPSIFDPLKATYFTVVDRQGQSHRFITVYPETWQESVEKLTAGHDSDGDSE
jgi:hypothetical protein